MTDDQRKEDNPSERLEEIKREEKEDASSYYAQGESKDNVNEETELSKPVATNLLVRASSFPESELIKGKRVDKSSLVRKYSTHHKVITTNYVPQLFNV